MFEHYKRKLCVVLAMILSLLLLLGCGSAVPPLSSSELDAPSGMIPPDELFEPEDSDTKPDSSKEDNSDENVNEEQDKVDKENNVEDEKQESVFIGMSVHYLDVGQGDCILICFPDKKSMMIDCGNGSASSVETIKHALSTKEIISLDYLVLTHPDIDHIGGVKIALKDVDVKKVYHPDVSEQKSGFENYFNALDFLKDKGAETKISLQGHCLESKDYKIAILSPKQKRQQDSSYRDFHLAEEPTESQINNLSPYIYLEYKGYRFLFTGDADKQNEDKLLNDYNSNLLKNVLSAKGVELDLGNIDFLKVSHHGSDGASTKDFLSLIKPKNAIISVGGDNVHGHPSTSVQQRLIDSNERVNILRTDVVGTVSVFINNKGVVAVKQQKE